LNRGQTGGICLVLGAGGFRGLAHAGVLGALGRHGIPIHSVIGVSIGGLVAAFYAGLGYEPGEIVGRLSLLSTPRLFALGQLLRRRSLRPFGRSPALATLREELERLKGLDLERLHFGVRGVGLLALDLFTGEEVFAHTAGDCPVPPGDVAMGGASIPGLFPWVRHEAAGRTYRLIDGGFSHSVPVERAFAPPFSADKVVAVDLQVFRGFREWRAGHWDTLRNKFGTRLVLLRPRVEEIGAILFRPGQAGELVRAGEAAVLEQVWALC